MTTMRTTRAGLDLLLDRFMDAWARHDLEAACARAKIDRCTPNDLRRTFGTRFRGLGVDPHVIGAAMGHQDSRMVERVYGRLPTDALAGLLASVAPTSQRDGGRGRS